MIGLFLNTVGVTHCLSFKKKSINMTELQLYKFISDRDIEWHREDNEGVPDIIIFPSFYWAKEFNAMLSNTHFDDGGIECVMMDGYLAIWMKDICEYYGIEIDNVFNDK